MKRFAFGLGWLLFSLIVLFALLGLIAHYGGPLSGIARKAEFLAQPH
ncbi:MAG: hypothetical protein IVW55_12220 [Chloroflexi bacterium]|nr:hypothetical protein [Chloroflexota bacterium]